MSVKAQQLMVQLESLKTHVLQLEKLNEIADAVSEKAIDVVKPRKRSRRSVRLLQTQVRQPATVYINGAAKLQKSRMRSRFNDAIGVMIALRTQPGIVDPMSGDVFYVINYKKSQGVWVGQHADSMGTILGPAFRTPGYAQQAINVVGHDRIEKAFKTLLFINS